MLKVAKHIAAASLLVIATNTMAYAQPVRMTCTGIEGQFGVYFDPSSETLIIDRERNMFDTQMEAHKYTVEEVTQITGGYKVVGLESAVGPRVIVNTGNNKSIEYTELHLGSAFETDVCR